MLKRLKIQFITLLFLDFRDMSEIEKHDIHDDSSESEEDMEPAKDFKRKLSTNKEIKNTVSYESMLESLIYIKYRYI